MKTYTIQLRVHFSGDKDDIKQREEAVGTALKMAAKHVLATAALISDKRKPEIALFTEDSFTPQQEIELSDDIDTTLYSSNSSGEGEQS